MGYLVLTLLRATVAACRVSAGNPEAQIRIEAYVWGMYGGHFFYRVANLSALGIIEDSCLEVHAA